MTTDVVADTEELVADIGSDLTSIFTVESVIKGTLFPIIGGLLYAGADAVTGGGFTMAGFTMNFLAAFASIGSFTSIAPAVWGGASYLLSGDEDTSIRESLADAYRRANDIVNPLVDFATFGLSEQLTQETRQFLGFTR